MSYNLYKTHIQSSKWNKTLSLRLARIHVYHHHHETYHRIQKSSTYSIKKEFSQHLSPQRLYNEARTAAPFSFRLFLRRVKRATHPLLPAEARAGVTNLTCRIPLFSLDFKCETSTRRQRAAFLAFSVTAP